MHTYVHAQAGSGAWIRMNNTYGANWELSKLPTPPFDVRLTTKAGKTTVLRCEDVHSTHCRPLFTTLVC